MTEANARAFRRVLKGAIGHEVLIPQVQVALHNPSFEAFEVPTLAFHERQYDGWLHPSTHPLWPERQLYYYLNQGDSFEHDPIGVDGTMAVTQGNFWHSFLQRVLLDSGLIRNVDMGATHAHDQAELYVEDKTCLTRGWMDGVLNSDVFSITVDEGLEIKTASSRVTNSLPKGPPGDPERIGWLKEKRPQYYAQAQEYLRMSKMSTQRFLFVNLEYPFAMHEIAVPFDYSYSQRVVDKYRSVIQAVADGEIPDACCAVRSDQARICPARLLCPVGRLSIE
jgi:hypothetical protein